VGYTCTPYVGTDPPLTDTALCWQRRCRFGHVICRWRASDAHRFDACIVLRLAASSAEEHDAEFTRAQEGRRAYSTDNRAGRKSGSDDHTVSQHVDSDTADSVDDVLCDQKLGQYSVSGFS